MTPRLLVVVFLTVALAITAYGDHRKPSVSVARTGAQGSVVGRIHACGGIGYAKLQCVRGTVVVLRGEIRSMRVSPGEGKLYFLPGSWPARESPSAVIFTSLSHRARM